MIRTTFGPLPSLDLPPNRLDFFELNLKLDEETLKKINVTYLKAPRSLGSVTLIQERTSKHTTVLEMLQKSYKAKDE